MTPDQRAFARAAVKNGRFQREEDAIPEAMALWEKHERAREELLADIDAGEASIAAGKGRDISKQSTQELAAEVKKRGRARFTTRSDR